MRDGAEVPGLAAQALRTLHVGPVDLEIPAGECLALWGPSGAGKTLLLRALADLDPHEGRVFLGGEEQAALRGPDWRRRVGYLPAESHWWAPTVGAHFENPAPEGLARFGFDADVLGWEVGRLSSGEKQRLALLRLLAREPAALLLDEPTANLDPENAERAERLLADYREANRAAVLWASHDRDQRARVANREARIEEGRLAPA